MPIATSEVLMTAAQKVKVGPAQQAVKGPHLRVVKTSVGKADKADAPAKALKPSKAAERAIAAANAAAQRAEVKQICEHLITVTKRMPDSYQKWDAIRTRAWITLLEIIKRATKAPAASKLERLRALKNTVAKFEQMSQMSCGALIDQGAESIWEGRIP